MPGRDQPPILIAPTGEAIDGRRLLAEAVGFGRALRSAGLAVDLGAAIDFARALGLVDVGNRGIVRDAGAAVFVRRRDEREVYDRVFDLFWRRRGRKLARPRLDPTATPDADREEGEPGASDEAGESAEATMTELARLGIQVAADADALEAQALEEGEYPAALAVVDLQGQDAAGDEAAGGQGGDGADALEAVGPAVEG